MRNTIFTISSSARQSDLKSNSKKSKYEVKLSKNEDLSKKFLSAHSKERKRETERAQTREAKRAEYYK